MCQLLCPSWHGFSWNPFDDLWANSQDSSLRWKLRHQVTQLRGGEMRCQGRRVFSKSDAICLPNFSSWCPYWASELLPYFFYFQLSVSILRYRTYGQLQAYFWDDHQYVVLFYYFLYTLPYCSNCFILHNMHALFISLGETTKKIARKWVVAPSQNHCSVLPQWQNSFFSARCSVSQNKDHTSQAPLHLAMAT